MKRLSRYIVSAALVLTLAPAAFAGQVVDRIVADVNGDIITLFDLNQRVKPFLERFKGRELTDADKAAIMGLKQKLLSSMVNNILIKQEVERLGIDVSDVEIENEVKTYRNRAQLTEEDLENQLKLEGMTIDQFKQQLKDEILRHKLLGYMVKRKVAITDEDIERYYEGHSYEFRGNREINLSLILCGPEVSADDLRARIEKGEITFADAATLYSTGPGVEQGGSIGAMAWADLAPEWQDALDGVEAGEMTQPFFIQGHEALLYVNGVEAAGSVALEDVRDAIYDKLFQERLEERFQEYMEKLKENALIDIRL